jgi:hypothetical protein
VDTMNLVVGKQSNQYATRDIGIAMNMLTAEVLSKTLRTPNSDRRISRVRDEPDEWSVITDAGETGCD